MDRKTWRARVVGLLGMACIVGVGPVAQAQEEGDPLREELADKPAAERIEVLQAKIENGDVSKEVYFHLGNAQYEANDIVAAVAAFELAVEKDGTFFKALVNLALMHDEQANYPKAIEVFERAAELEPKNPDVWSHMGNTYYAKKDHARATELYRKALALDAKSTHALYSMGVAFADAGMFREAVRYWKRVIQADPEGEMGQNATENVELLEKYLIP